MNPGVERSARNLPLLRVDDRLALAAERHARHMVRSGFFSHVAPDGTTPANRVRASGYIVPGAAWASSPQAPDPGPPSEPSGPTAPASDAR